MVHRRFCQTFDTPLYKHNHYCNVFCKCLSNVYYQKFWGDTYLNHWLSILCWILLNKHLTNEMKIINLKHLIMIAKTFGQWLQQKWFVKNLAKVYVNILYKKGKFQIMIIINCQYTCKPINSVHILYQDQ